MLVSTPLTNTPIGEFPPDNARRSKSLGSQTMPCTSRSVIARSASWMARNRRGRKDDDCSNAPAKLAASALGRCVTSASGTLLASSETP